MGLQSQKKAGSTEKQIRKSMFNIALLVDDIEFSPRGKT